MKLIRRREFIGLIAGTASFSFWPLLAGAQQHAAHRDLHTLSLTSRERAEIWRRLGKQAMKAAVPAGLNVGEKVPSTMHLLSFGGDLRKGIPTIQSYRYALLQGQVLIVDPETKKIMSILGG
jgi:hypothetical protein